MAVVIYRARPTDTLNRVFAVSLGLIAGFQWFEFQTLFNGLGVIDRAFQVAWVVTVAFLGVTFFHCATLFPTPLRLNVRRALLGWYALSALVAASWTLSKWLLWSQGVSPVVALLDVIGSRGSTVNLAWA